MPITSVDKDIENLTITVTADFAVPRSRLWDAYVDPRQIEKFWGPPTYPATFTRHDVFPGGRTHYYMTGPDGDISAGYWEFRSVDPGRGFEVTDGFAGPDGTPNPDMPSMRMSFSFHDTDQGSRLVTTTHFNSAAELDQLLGMGMEEGLTAAMGQIDAVLADLTSFAADRATDTQVLSDTQVRVSRVIRGSVEQVWQAHHDPELLPRWMLGPDGWTMPECQVSQTVGDTYRYVWAAADGTGRFGFTGTVLEIDKPHRAVTTEHYFEADGEPSPEGTVNELTLTAVEGGTLLALLITYPSAELRDQVLGTGMTDGMETSYVRLEREVLTTGSSVS